MKILGVNIGHLSSACLFDNGSLIYFNQEERLSKRKKCGGIPVNCLQEIKKITTEIDLLLITDYNHNNDTYYAVDSVARYLGFNVKDYYGYHKPHHLCHASKAFSSSNFEEALIIVWDGRGSNYNLSDGTNAYETTSVFHASYEEGFKLLNKKVYRPQSKIESDLKNLKIIFFTEYVANNAILAYKIESDFNPEINGTIHDIGHYYSHVAEHFGYDEEDCGKLMGLHSYGKENKFLSNLICDGGSFKPDLFCGEKINVEEFNFLETNIEENEEMLLDFSYETQKSLEKIELNYIQKILKKHSCKNLILTGGVTLNIVANSFIKKNLSKEINLYVDPLCGDEGNSIGVCQLHSIHNDHKKLIVPDHLYLCGNFSDYNFKIEINENLIENASYSDVTDLLIGGNIVSIFQGKSEAGPRALGNRSILFDPRIKNGKDIVNRVKRREPFRPFACSVLLEESHKWFDMSLIEESPHMMYSFDALPGVKDIIPSVIHVDNTCRIQTVTEEQNFHYYNLIKDFYKKTSVPILFNTSFNLAGDPIVETIDDALNTLRRSELEYLHLPEINQIVYVPNK
jgi:carbamoyltransferase